MELAEIVQALADEGEWRRLEGEGEMEKSQAEVLLRCLEHLAAKHGEAQHILPYSFLIEDIHVMAAVQVKRSSNGGLYYLETDGWGNWAFSDRPHVLARLNEAKA